MPNNCSAFLMIRLLLLIFCEIYKHADLHLRPDDRTSTLPAPCARTPSRPPYPRTPTVAPAIPRLDWTPIHPESNLSGTSGEQGATQSRGIGYHGSGQTAPGSRPLP